MEYESEIPKSLYVIVGLIVVSLLTFVILIITGVVKFPSEDTTRALPREKCESHGGIYYPGVLGADNCVFPPKESND